MVWFQQIASHNYFCFLICLLLLGSWHKWVDKDNLGFLGDKMCTVYNSWKLMINCSVGIIFRRCKLTCGHFYNMIFHQSTNCLPHSLSSFVDWFVDNNTVCFSGTILIIIILPIIIIRHYRRTSTIIESPLCSFPPFHKISDSS